MLKILSILDGRKSIASIAFASGMTMSDFGELAHLDATAQAELVRKKEVQPIELVDAAIERIEALNPKLNAVVTKMVDQARETALGELPEGPFTGVPFLLKDILGMCQGVPMTMGSALLQGFVPDHDSELVARLRRAGLIFIGKTNVPEFGILPTTESQLFGPCRNPWDTARSTGGSSGGAAAAVASGMVPMAHANDGGGSIRIPASCCGLFGLKPTRARNPLGPDFGEGWGGLVAEHAVTRSVRDSAALLDATAGPDIGDPYWAPPMARPFSKEVGVELAYLGRAPDIGPYEYGDKNYWIPGRQLDKASRPIPPHGATGVKLDADLMWLPGREVRENRVFTGTDPNALELRSVQDNNIFVMREPPIACATVYWRVDTVIAGGQVLPGDIWHFTTDNKTSKR